jgi:hypothetical protein
VVVLRAVLTKNNEYKWLSSNEYFGMISGDVSFCRERRAEKEKTLLKIPMTSRSRKKQEKHGKTDMKQDIIF